MAVISVRDKEIDDVSLITTLAVPTIRGFLYALSTHPEGKAFITPFPMDASTFNISDDGRIFDSDGREIPPMEFEVTKVDLKKLDMPLLAIIHTIFWLKFEASGYKDLPKQIRLYLPDLIRIMGVSANQNNVNRDVVINKIIAFHNSIGKSNNKMFPVLLFRELDVDKNIVSIESPYFEYIVQKMHEESLDQSTMKKELKNAIRLEKPRPTHSFIVKTSIASERSKMAVANVIIIVTLIERAGKNEAHIKASTLVARNPLLETTLMETKATGNRNNILRRVFVKTWELLQTQTLLFDKYKNVQIPNIIPTYQTLSSTVLTFRHDGKEVLNNSAKSDDIDGGADIKTVGEV